MTQQNFIDFFLAKLEKRQNILKKKHPEYSDNKIKEKAYNYFLSDDCKDKLGSDAFVDATVGRLLLENKTPEQAYFDYKFNRDIKAFNKTELTICKKILSFSDKTIFYNQICALLDIKKMEKAYKKYDYKFANNSIDIRGKDIKVISGDYIIRMLEADDLKNYSVFFENEVACNKQYGYPDESSLLAITSSPKCACVIIEDKRGSARAASFVWVDEEKDAFVFDDFNPRYCDEVDQMIEALKDYIKEIPYKNVYMGMGYNDTDFMSYGKVYDKNTKLTMPTVYGETFYSDFHSENTKFLKLLTLKENGEVIEKEPEKEEIEL